MFALRSTDSESTPLMLLMRQLPLLPSLLPSLLSMCQGRLCESEGLGALGARDGNSVIRRASLPAGIYAIRVRGWNHGAFQLSLRCWDGAAPTVADALAAATVLGCDQTVVSETQADGTATSTHALPKAALRLILTFHSVFGQIPRITKHPGCYSGRSSASARGGKGLEVAVAVG